MLLTKLRLLLNSFLRLSDKFNLCICCYQRHLLRHSIKQFICRISTFYKHICRCGLMNIVIGFVTFHSWNFTWYYIKHFACILYIQLMTFRELFYQTLTMHCLCIQLPALYMVLNDPTVRRMEIAQCLLGVKPTIPLYHGKVIFPWGTS